MREPYKKSSESSDFRCQAETVFGALCDEDGYREWYGWPKHAALDSVEPEFSAGAKLRFRGQSGIKTITAFVKGRLLTISSDSVEETFSIEPTVTGCRVTYTVAVFDRSVSSFDNLRGMILETLRSLKDYVYSLESTGEKAEEARRSVREGSIAYFFRGYTKPTLASEQVYGDLTTEVSARPSGWRLLIGLMFITILMSVLCITQTFENGDIIPSSGLSVKESSLITKETALSTAIGTDRDELEVEISCQGTLRDNSVFVYHSDEKEEDGTYGRLIYINYDTYWNVREVGYLDTELSGTPYAGEYVNLDELSPYGTLADIETAVGCESTAFVRGKNGSLTAYFGEIPDGAELMKGGIRTTLVVTLDPAADVSYYNYYGDSFGDNPEPDSLTIKQLRQASTVSEYIDQRSAYERALILPGKSVSEAAAILKSNYTENTKEDNGYESFVFYCSSSTPGCNATYTYKVRTFEGIIMSVSFVNNTLTNADRDALGDVSSYDISSAEDIFTLEEMLGILPSAAEVDENSVILRYGLGNVVDIGGETTYPLSVQMFRGTMSLLAYSISDEG